jgi:hypothetical protein
MRYTPTRMRCRAIEPDSLIEPDSRGFSARDRILASILPSSYRSSFSSDLAAGAVNVTVYATIKLRVV